MKSKVAKNKKEFKKTFMLDCACGVELLRIDKWKDDNIVFIQLYENSFYGRQRGILPTIIDRLKFIWSIARGKEYLLFELTLDNKKKIEEFKKFIKENL